MQNCEHIKSGMMNCALLQNLVACLPFSFLNKLMINNHQVYARNENNTMKINVEMFATLHKIMSQTYCKKHFTRKFNPTKSIDLFQITPCLE